ncbi:hypothetical protein LIMHP_02140 [Leptospira interrogans serovar Manilae]|uniref:Uncharacterized protein n=1 Tax=Leptospira kirschneri str. H1 TaxID=1049966 RepID=A0A0E2B6Q1_9LEPT|nr:hypothetical protein LIMLP_02145 [Leptospira interrogans serovar Manilae]AKP28645.1 hypothetical protein LIMHP_02140 [Leptospira interrogans serovar Manilae]EKO16986.1 hypothetical protein LEP1GSC081_3928 [Leptospira kirschneri str. H1]
MFPGFNFMGIHRVILILKRTYLLDIKLTILLYMLSVRFQKSIEKEIRKLLRQNLV